MRHAYLRPRDGSTCQRGGVSGQYDHGGSTDYELEIGHNSDASPEMLALCAHRDELFEFLEKCDSALGNLILHSIKAETKRLGEELRE